MNDSESAAPKPLQILNRNEDKTVNPGLKHMGEQGIFKKILVPTDGSIPSVVAQEVAVFIAKKFKSKVTAIHVVAHELMNPQVRKFYPVTSEYVPIGPGIASLPATEHTSTAGATSIHERLTNEINDWFRQRGEQYIAEALALFKKEGVPAEHKIIEHADPAHTIVQEAEKGSYDLIVLGRSEQEQQEPHLGSTAVKISRHAHTPVLITGEKRQISKMLAPVDGSESATKALQYATILAKKMNAKITLLHIQESSLFKLKPEVAKGIGSSILSRAAEQAKGVKMDQKLQAGDPAKMIMQTAKDGGYDLIVMGNKGHSAIERFLLGSVSDHVLHYADRSVLLVR